MTGLGKIMDWGKSMYMGCLRGLLQGSVLNLKSLGKPGVGKGEWRQRSVPGRENQSCEMPVCRSLECYRHGRRPAARTMNHSTVESAERGVQRDGTGHSGFCGPEERVFYLKCNQKPQKDLKQENKCSLLSTEVIFLAALQRRDY